MAEKLNRLRLVGLTPNSSNWANGGRKTKGGDLSELSPLISDAL